MYIFQENILKEAPLFELCPSRISANKLFIRGGAVDLNEHLEK